MKRIIAAALSVLVGAFGYTIVDKALENRVATLESEVVELREEVSRYHPANNSFTTSKNTTTHTYPPTTGDIMLEVGDYLSESSNSMHKFMLRKWSYGSVQYISPTSYGGGTQPWIDYNLHVAAATSEIFTPTDSRLTTAKTTTKLSAYTTKPSTTEFIPENPTDSRITATRVPTTAPITYEDFFLYVTDSSAQVTSVEGDISYYYWYDNNYSQMSEPIKRDKTTVEFTFKGYTDPVFAGMKVIIHPNYYFKLERLVSNTINTDGAFEYKAIYSTDDILYNTSNYYLNSVTVK